MKVKMRLDETTIRTEIFISHMVQMKVIFYVVYMQNLIMLYIPHGSDESYNIWEIEKSNISFISHMVQMKATRTRIINNVFKLYIPHGSDERKEKTIWLAIKTILYIPHGSDESSHDERLKI